MYFTSPISETLRLTSSVNATGEKTTRAPDCRRTGVAISNHRMLTFINLTNGASSANLYAAEAPERNRECGNDSRYDITNDHNLRWVGGH
jgi:hypothetical protein